MNFLEQFGTQTTFIFIVLVVTISFLLLRTGRYYSRQRQEGPTWSRAARPKSSQPARHLDAMPETARWEVEMHETARELKAQLDSKMRALQALIAEADRAAARLEAALNNKADMASDHPRHGGSPLFNPQPGSLPTNQAEALRPAPAATASGASPQHRHEEIYTLADHGLSDSAIAQRLGMPIGEVELILSLRGKR